MGDWMGVAVRGTLHDDDLGKLKGLGPENNDEAYVATAYGFLSTL
jgi:hypothetical protein